MRMRGRGDGYNLQLRDTMNSEPNEIRLLRLAGSYARSQKNIIGISHLCDRVHEGSIVLHIVECRNRENIGQSAIWLLERYRFRQPKALVNPQEKITRATARSRQHMMHSEWLTETDLDQNLLKTSSSTQAAPLYFCDQHEASQKLELEGCGMQAKVC